MTTSITPGELAKEAGIRRQMVYNYISAERIPAFRDKADSNRWKIKREDADAYLEYRKSKADKKKAEIERQLAWRKRDR